MPNQARRSVLPIAHPPDVFDAVRELCPDVGFSCEETYDSIVWSNERPANVPTEEEVNAKIAELQEVWDSNQYQLQRYDKYPKIEQQLALLWDDMDAGIIPGKETSTWYAAIKEVKDSISKPS